MKQSYTIRHGALEGVEAFLAVARRRSFRRAAADLGVTPSAVSQAIRALEARIGAALFLRTTRSVGLALVPEPLAAQAIREGDLVTVLDGLGIETPGVYLFHPGKRQVLPKLRAFIDHITANLPA